MAPTGDIDLATVPLLRERLDATVEAGTRRVIVNLQNVSYIDSSGLALLLSRTRRLMAAGGVLSLVNASDQVMRSLQIARLVDILHASGRDRAPVPSLAPGAMPRWSRTVRVCGGVEHLCEYRRRVDEMIAGLGLTADERFDVALATGEALSNAYDHAGCRGAELSVRAYDDRLVIEVADRGCGYEIAAGEVPVESEERGRGIKLMRMLVDGVEVRRRGDADCGTRVTLTKLLHGGVSELG